MTSPALKPPSKSSLAITINERIKAPDGTEPFARPNFKKGVARIYNELNINCLPVTINSGEVWPKNGYLNRNKNITITILKPIKPGLSTNEFLYILQDTMYEVLDKTSNPSSA